MSTLRRSQPRALSRTCMQGHPDGALGACIRPATRVRSAARREHHTGMQELRRRDRAGMVRHLAGASLPCPLRHPDPAVVARARPARDRGRAHPRSHPLGASVSPTIWRAIRSITRDPEQGGWTVTLSCGHTFVVRVTPTIQRLILEWTAGCVACGAMDQ